MAMKRAENVGSDSDVALRVAKLWPHREHEANSVLALLCHTGVHRWRRLDLDALVPGKQIFHCFRCSKVKVEGLVYDVWP